MKQNSRVFLFRESRRLIDLERISERGGSEGETGKGGVLEGGRRMEGGRERGVKRERDIGRKRGTEGRGGGERGRTLSLYINKGVNGCVSG